MKTIIITTLFIINISICSQYKVEWSAEFTSEGNFSIDKAEFIAVDKEGSVIVTGTINGDGINEDLTTIKYDKNGKQVWAAIYNGPGGYHDRPLAMALDENGNIYITGNSDGEGTASDFITIKYNPNGTQEWAARYASKGGMFDEARSIALDKNGNVYVTGAGAHYVTGNSGSDWITIKYNSAGEQIRIIGYDDGITDDAARALTVDNDGNIYVAGQCKGPAYHMAVIKYDSAGVKQWMARYDGAQSSDDRPVDIKTDNKGFIYVTGFSSEANNDFITIKYDTDGNEIWRKNHNGLANMRDEAESIIVDSEGNVYVAGVVTSKKNRTNRCIIKYGPDGNEEWNVTSPKNISKNIDKLSMVMHDNKYLLVTGSWHADSKPDVTEMIVDCFDKSGALLWQAIYNPEGNSVPVALALTSDENGNIYVTGYIIKAKSMLDYCTVKFSK